MKVEISYSGSVSRSFLHIAIPTHKRAEISCAETMCTFSLHKCALYKFVKKCDRTDRRTDGQTLLEDASRIKTRLMRVGPSRVLAFIVFRDGQTDIQTDRQPVYILPSLRQEVKKRSHNFLQRVNG